MIEKNQCMTESYIKTIWHTDVGPSRRILTILIMSVDIRHYKNSFDELKVDLSR